MSREKSYSEVGARLRLAREQIGLNQQAFASSLGIKQSWLSELETGLKEPSDVLLMALQYRYMITAAWIRTGKGPMYAEKDGAESAGPTPRYEMTRKIAEMVDELDEEGRQHIFDHVQATQRLLDRAKKRA